MSQNEAIKKLLSRNVESVIEKNHLEKRLLAGEKLRVKLGIDPTSPDLHLGHAVVLRKLREFQDLGCEAVLIIGDFTARIGDPSGRDKTRPPLGEKDIKENMKKYLEHAGKIINVGNAEIRYNSEWLKKLDGTKILELLSTLSVQQIIERSDFSERLKAHKSIKMHEIIYPVMQAYDSAVVKADVELGGTDQTFNLMIGRELMEKLHMAPQDIVTAPLLEGTDGVKKMSKSLGNYIALNDEAGDMFGKIMAIPDKLIEKYFLLCTDLDEKEVARLQKELKPKELKERLGLEIVKIYHGARFAEEAKEKFSTLFSKKEIPKDLPELKLGSGQMTALDIALASGVSKSKSEARRLIEQGGFEFDGATKRVPGEILNLREGAVLRAGKKRFFRIKL